MLFSGYIYTPRSYATCYTYYPGDGDRSNCAGFRLEFVPSRINSSSSGHLEVFYNSEWRRVCSAGFGNIDANVACRAMGHK